MTDSAFQTGLFCQLTDFACIEGPIEDRDFIQAAFPVGVIIRPSAEEQLFQKHAGCPRFRFEFDFRFAIQVDGQLVTIANESHMNRARRIDEVVAQRSSHAGMV